jgi:hypothetical protein
MKNKIQRRIHKYFFFIIFVSYFSAKITFERMRQPTIHQMREESFIEEKKVKEVETFQYLLIRASISLWIWIQIYCNLSTSLTFPRWFFFLPHLVYCWLPHSLGCYFCGKIRNKNNEKRNIYGSYVVFLFFIWFN